MFFSREHARQTQNVIPPLQSPSVPSPGCNLARWMKCFQSVITSASGRFASPVCLSPFGPVTQPFGRGEEGREEEIISLLITYHKQWNPAGSVPARYISKGNGGGQSVTQGRYLWKMTVCKYLNLGQGCSSDTEECCKIGRVSSQHLFHQDLSNLQWSLDSLGIAGTSRPLSIGGFHFVCMEQSKEL